MIFVNLIGGLGNQMFQYAFGRSVALLSKTKLKLDIHAFGTNPSYPFPHYTLWPFEIDLLNIPREYATISEIRGFRDSIFNRMNIFRKRQVVKENSSNFNSSALCAYSHDVYLVGYWQSEKYFRHCEKEIRNDFSFREEMSPENSALALKMRNENSVSLHIRRGDYASTLNANSILRPQSLHYYLEAMQMISSRIRGCVFYVFSDDLAWARENIPSGNNCNFIEHTKGKPAEDMRLMSMCRHHIISNSSFGWWGAWLNPDKNKMVVAPKIWFSSTEFSNDDIIPETWIKI